MSYCHISITALAIHTPSFLVPSFLLVCIRKIYLSKPRNILFQEKKNTFIRHTKSLNVENSLKCAKLCVDCLERFNL